MNDTQKHYPLPKLKRKKLFTILLCILLFTSLVSGCGKKESSSDVVTLRVCNWEEYIDEGGWDKEETISLESKDILGKNSMIDDFCKWYQKTTGTKIKVEYSCFGTNEELYNQITLGDQFDLVCPSEYMIMKLMSENKLEPYDTDFFSTTGNDNYYARGVAPYIRALTKKTKVNGKSIYDYAAGYMWGTTGIVYNPKEVSQESAKSWSLLVDPNYKCQVTIKDNVRDTYFAALGILKSTKLLQLRQQFKNQNLTLDRYQHILKQEMNDSSDSTINTVENLLQKNKNHFYSFESDSGKADMITGKVVANYQWSGDAVYTMDQAEEDDYTLNYSVPEECSNLWFDGWVMLKDGLGQDSRKKAAAEAFVNFLSMPENVVRNMYYIGYTSVITGGEDDTIFQYADWCYGTEDTQNTIDYDISYFFGDGTPSGNYVITTTKDQANRQLYAQYPPEEVLNRCTIMDYVGENTNKKLNQMWINVRCFNPFRK